MKLQLVLAVLGFTSILGAGRIPLDVVEDKLSYYGVKNPCLAIPLLSEVTDSELEALRKEQRVAERAVQAQKKLQHEAKQKALAEAKQKLELDMKQMKIKVVCSRFG